MYQKLLWLDPTYIINRKKLTLENLEIFPPEKFSNFRDLFGTYLIDFFDFISISRVKSGFFDFVDSGGMCQKSKNTLKNGLF